MHVCKCGSYGPKPHPETPAFVGVFYMSEFLDGAGNKLRTANGKSDARAKYDPDTNKSAPASQQGWAVLSVMPPSTDMVNFNLYFLLSIVFILPL